MRTAFSRRVEDEAWERQAGLCAGCGRSLVYYNRGQGGSGAYWPVELRPGVYGGGRSVENCVLLCTRCQEEKAGFSGDDGQRRSAVLDLGQLPHYSASGNHECEDSCYEPGTATVVSRVLATGHLVLS